MFVRATRFTSRGSNGGYWVGVVFPRLFFLFEKRFFFHTGFTAKKSLRDLRQKNFGVKKRDLRQKKSCATCAKKNYKRVTVISTIEVRFPPSLC